MPEQGFQTEQNLSQVQTLSPQMQQRLQVLQSATLDLRTLLQNEMDANPVIEDTSNEVSLEEQMEERDEFDREIEELTYLDEEWRTYLSQSRSYTSRSEEDEERRQHMFDSLVDPVTLHEHLMEQLGTSDAEGERKKIAEMLIGNIDEQGYLQTPLDELCITTALPLPTLQTALDLVQSFHPTGVGTVDLRECLLIQLERLGKEHSLEHRIVDQHLDDLARNRIPQIAKRLNVGVEQISQAAEMISTLEPRPGRMFTLGNNNYISPDVTIQPDGDDFQIIIHNEQIPSLRISNHYKDLMSKRDSDPDVRQYIRDKIRSGKFLITSIEQRQQTIRNIATEILKRQREFFENGPAYLKPLNMAQVADVVGVHETTVSRAVSGKYIATPHGVFEMKYFFTTGYTTKTGGSMSNTSVKEAIAELIKKEPTNKPYSDQVIVSKLKEEGIEIARRTVAKYREDLNILPSSMRKKFAN